MHGRRLDLYRTFENLSVGSNVATHCWLLSLEEEYMKHGKLPDTLYHQVEANYKYIVNLLIYMYALGGWRLRKHREGSVSNL